MVAMNGVGESPIDCRIVTFIPSSLSLGDTGRTQETKKKTGKQEDLDMLVKPNPSIIDPILISHLVYRKRNQRHIHLGYLTLAPARRRLRPPNLPLQSLRGHLFKRLRPGG